MCLRNIQSEVTDIEVGPMDKCYHYNNYDDAFLHKDHHPIKTILAQSQRWSY